jgi:hypothetical protein
VIHATECSAAVGERDFLYTQRILRSPVTQVDRPGRLSAQRLPDRLPVRSLTVAFLLAPLPWLVAHFFPPHNTDAVAVLQFAERWLAGERLYVELIDINPPLIYLLSLIPAAIGRYTPMSSTTALVVCTVGFVAVAIALAANLLSRQEREADGAQRALLLPLFLCIGFVLPGYDFTQREHLMTIAALPYLLLAAHRAGRQHSVEAALAVSIALLAAIGFALKPHFLVVPVLVEVYVAWVCGIRSASRAPVPWTMAAFMAAYVLWALVMLPEYLTSVLPLYGQHYAGYDIDRLRMLYDSRLTPTVGLLVSLVAVTLSWSHSHLVRISALAAVGAVTFAVIQGKGWAYHTLPAEGFVLLLAAALGCELVERVVDSDTRAPRRLLISGLALGFLLGAYFMSMSIRGSLFHYKLSSQSRASAQIAEGLRQHSAGRPVVVISPDHSPLFPTLNYAGAVQGLRFMTMWPLVAVYQQCLPGDRLYREPEAMPPIERAVLTAVADDLQRQAPNLIVVDKLTGMPFECGRRFDFVEYLVRDARIAAQWLLFEPAGETERYRFFTRR